MKTILVSIFSVALFMMISTTTLAVDDGAPGQQSPDNAYVTVSKNSVDLDYNTLAKNVNDAGACAEQTLIDDRGCVDLDMTAWHQMFHLMPESVVNDSTMYHNLAGAPATTSIGDYGVAWKEVQAPAPRTCFRVLRMQDIAYAGLITSTTNGAATGRYCGDNIHTGVAA